jgi:hypothetical protein
MGWRYPYVLDEEKTKEQLSGLGHTLRTPLQRTLNPQVSGSNPEGRTNSLVRTFFRAKVSSKVVKTSQLAGHAGSSEASVRFVAKSGPRESAAFETRPIVSSVAHHQLRVLDACVERRTICVSGYAQALMGDLWSPGRSNVWGHPWPE